MQKVSSPRHNAWWMPLPCFATQPMTLQLRYLQTLQDIGVEKNTTIVFPLPLEMMTLFNRMSDMRMPAPPAAAEIKPEKQL
jgi:hypothetical protein